MVLIVGLGKCVIYLLTDVQVHFCISFTILHPIQALSATQGRGLLIGDVLRVYREGASVEYYEDM